MPLKPGKSKKVIGENIAELHKHGTKPRSNKQIVAIAFAESRKSAKHTRTRKAVK